MKRLVCWAVFCLFASAALAVAPRTYIGRTNNVSALLYDRFAWSQTDEVQIDLWPRSYIGALDLDGWFPMLFISDPITELIYIGKTGTVVEAGHVRFDLQREESNLSVSNLYLLSARLYHVSEQTTQYVTIARGQLNIHWSPDAEGYDLVGGRAVTSMVFNVTIISSGATTGASGSWTNLTEVPLGFADDIDNTNDLVEWSEIEGIVGTGSNQVARGDHQHPDLISRIEDLEDQSGSSGGGGTFITNNIYIDNSTHITGMAGFVVAYTNAYLPPTTNAGVVTHYVNTNAGSVSGADGMVTINGFRSNVFNFGAIYPVVVTNINGDIYYAVGSVEGGLVVTPTWTNASDIVPDGMVTQLFVFGAGQTNAYVEAWSPPSWYSPGMAFSGYLSGTGGQIVGVVAGYGGAMGSNKLVNGGWPGGGSARSTNGIFVGSSGGYCALISGTNYILILPGGAGLSALNAIYGRVPAGNHISGISLGNAQSGSSATATNNGAGATANTNALAGSFLQGGAGTPSGGSNPGGGGSPGFNSGGGGCGSISSANNAGGSGVAFVNTNFWSAWYCYRQATDSANPPRTDSIYYLPPYGVAPSGTATNDALAPGGRFVFVRPPP